MQFLQRARELVVQASNSGVLDKDNDDDFQKIQDELNEIGKEFERINSDTEFNKKKLLDGNYTSQYFQVGANKSRVSLFLSLKQIGLILLSQVMMVKQTLLLSIQSMV